jgi:TonB family protein
LLRLLRTGSCRVNQFTLDYAVMEYADENLAAVLTERALTAWEAREMLEPLLAALAYIHGEGMVHGHLKPANVMAVADQLKLSVDGISRVGDLGVAPSTPGRYDPPEFRDRGCSPVGDVWSLGMTLVEALTQRLPSPAGRKQPPVLPATLPAEFVPLARACLLPDPRRRAPLRDIAALFRRRGPQPEEQPPAVPPAAPRRWLSLALVGAAAILLAAVLAGPRLVHRPEPSAAVEPPMVPAAPIPVAVKHEALPVAATPDSEPESPAPAAPAPALPAAVSGAQTEARAGQAIRQVLPDVPAKARRTIHGKVTIGVRASVDATGHVTSARLDSGGSRYFANLALQAVEQWAFEPVKVEGQDAASEWLLRFEITGQGTEVYPSRVAP